MQLYQKQMLLGVFLLFLVVFLGLSVVSITMEKITLRDGQDFIFFTTMVEGDCELWEFRFLGKSLVFNKDSAFSHVQRIRTQIVQYIEGCLLWLKNRQEV